MSSVRECAEALVEFVITDAITWWHVKSAIKSFGNKSWDDSYKPTVAESNNIGVANSATKTCLPTNVELQNAANHPNNGVPSTFSPRQDLDTIVDDPPVCWLAEELMMIEVEMFSDFGINPSALKQALFDIVDTTSPTAQPRIQESNNGCTTSSCLHANPCNQSEDESISNLSPNKDSGIFGEESPGHWLAEELMMIEIEMYSNSAVDPAALKQALFEIVDTTTPTAQVIQNTYDNEGETPLSSTESSFLFKNVELKANDCHPREEKSNPKYLSIYEESQSPKRWLAEELMMIEMEMYSNSAVDPAALNQALLEIVDDSSSSVTHQTQDSVRSGALDQQVESEEYSYPPTKVKFRKTTNSSNEIQQNEKEKYNHTTSSPNKDEAIFGDESQTCRLSDEMLIEEEVHNSFTVDAKLLEAVDTTNSDSLKSIVLEAKSNITFADPETLPKVTQQSAIKNLELNEIVYSISANFDCVEEGPTTHQQINNSNYIPPEYVPIIIVTSYDSSVNTQLNESSSSSSKSSMSSNYFERKAPLFSSDSTISKSCRDSNYEVPPGLVKSIVTKFETNTDASAKNSAREDTRKPSLFYIGDDSEETNIPVISSTSYAASTADRGQRRFISMATPTESQSVVSADRARCSRFWGAENFTTALSILSFAGTLGNLLRLPRMVYFHGGGVFLLVYVLLTLVFGIPLTFLEIGLGQFCQHGTVKLWRAVNLFRGVGYAKALLSFALAISYSTQVASALALLSYTANGPVPFTECGALPSATENGSLAAAVIFDMQERRERCLLDTVLASAFNQPMWFGIRLVFILLVWALVLICVMKRSVTYRRSMYFLFPGFFALTAALLVEHSSPASAANAGLDKLFTFDWAALGDVQVWYFATVQMFFSLQVGFGNISTCAGRIYPKSNAFWTAICLVGSSLLMGVAAVILTYLWIGALDTSNPGFPVPDAFVLSLIYQVSTTASAPGAYLAYLLVLIAGMSSMIALTYTVLVAVAVETKRRWRWRHINGVMCLTACVIATLSLIPGELSISHVIEHYMVARGVVMLAVLELIGFAVVYGCSNLYNDLEFVIGSKLSSAWRSLWLVTPCVLIVVEVCSYCLLPLDHEVGQKDDALWKMGLGWLLYACCWVLVLTCAIHQVWVQVDYNLPQKFMSALKPSRNWGPVDPIYRHCWVQWRNRYNLTGARDFTLKRRGTRDYTHHARTATPAKTDDSLQWPQSRH